jgi:hypothetical protein
VAPRKKPKPKPKKTKQAKPTKPARVMTLEYEGWKAGDMCWCVCLGDTKATQCEVLEFHLDDTVTPSVSVTQIITGKYRCLAINTIAETLKQAKEIKNKDKEQ